MVAGKVHVGDVSTDFQITVQETLVDGTNVVFNLEDTTARQMIFTAPDGTETTVTANILNGTGTDGILRYINTAVSINATGFWKYRAKVTLTGGAIHQTNDAIFEVI